MLRGLQSCASWTTTIYMFWDPYSILVRQPYRQLQSKTNCRHISTEQPDWMKWILGMGFSGLWSPLFVLAFPFLVCWLFLIKFGTVSSSETVKWYELGHLKKLLGPERQHTGLSKLWSSFQFGTKAPGTHRALNGHSFQVGTKVHWMQHFPTGTRNDFNSAP
jgi:hypothetical protein